MLPSPEAALCQLLVENSADLIVRTDAELLEHVGQGVCFFDGARRLLLCNRHYAGLYRLSPEALVPGLVTNRSSRGAGTVVSLLLPRADALPSPGA